MESLKQAALGAITYPAREYYKFQDYRHRRIRDESVSWDLNIWKRLHPSLQQGFKYCLIVVSSAWTLCLIFTIWVATGHKAEPGLVFTLQTGSCKAAESVNFWVHLLINSLASALYAVSSFIMQRLAAPTRQDIDRAHQARSSMKIGSLAITNFALLSKKRLAVFGVLWASSLPLHLMFNSLIVYTSTNAEWSSYVVSVSEDTLKSYTANTSTLEAPGTRNYAELPGDLDDGEFVAQYILHQQPPLVDLPLDECINTFGSGSSETWGDVVLVYITEREYSLYTSWVLSQPYVRIGSYLPAEIYGDPWHWMCDALSDTCDAQRILDSGEWIINDLKISRCLARRLPELCELNVSLGIMVSVLACISGKLIATLLAIVLCREMSLLTVGDAVASFLETPDKAPPDTRPTYMKSSDSKISSRRRLVISELGTAFWPSTIFGLVGMSLAWWFFNFTFRQTSIAYSDSKTRFDFNTMLRFGFGKMPTRWTEELEQRIITYKDAQNTAFTYTSGAVIANLPQIALSGFYLVFNNYITRLFIALEFRSFSTRRRGLRVSTPEKGTKQRGAHFLQIPLRYSLLSMAVFALLHTFLSQTLFLRRVYAIFPQSFDDGEDIGKELIPMIGYSPVATFALAILFTSLVISGILIGLIYVDWRMPDTTGNSLTIGQACHPPDGTLNAHEGEVRWGVTTRGKTYSTEKHVKCSFSLLPVRPPEVGERIVL
ncbi:hypothetical protein F5Y15DRAFT_120594 [Xylariaceae sp. FL0016]|nr:hypothetical protein F5Y15DRAFT_120594 [Xylariaceae sp. FL0016]